MFSVTNGLTAVKFIDNGDIEIICAGQGVLRIGEVSDEDTINLFLTPLWDSEIIKSDSPEECDWTHEVLARRNKKSKEEFKKNQPLYKLRE